MKRLVLIALPVAAAFAQQFEPFDATERQASAKAAQWMQSPGYREKAWGAYLAGKYRLQDQAASLVSQLVALRGLAGDTLHVDSPEFGAIQATLDALIQLGHPVDAASLLPFRKQWANEVLILLAEDPQANREALLAMAEQRDPADTRWVAIHNLLVGARSAGMAARLLAGVNVIHVFYVMDRAGYPAGSGGGGGGAIYDGLPGFAPGFPHAGVYDLFLSRQADGVLFAPGTHPVYYRRATTARCRTFPEIDRQEYGLEYLAELGRLPLRAIKLALTPSTVIQWAGAKAYKQQVSTAVHAQLRAIQQFLSGLKSAEVLTPEEAEALKLRIFIDPDDQRKSGAALPDFAPVPVPGS